MPPPMSTMPGTTTPGSTTPSGPSLPPPMRPQPPRSFYPQRPAPSLAAIQREQQEQMLVAQAMLQQQRQAGVPMGPPMPRRGPVGPPPGPRFPHRTHMGHMPGDSVQMLQPIQGVTISRSLDTKPMNLVKGVWLDWYEHTH